MFAWTLLRRASYFSREGRLIFVKQYGTTTAEPQFSGIQNKFTNNLQFITRNSYETIPIYRILDVSGHAQLPANIKLENEMLIKMYRTMTTLNVMDKILYESQRQGRISFYMTNTGEEAVQIGSAAALNLTDLVYAQYREAGVLLWRGFTLSQFMNQCYGNCQDNGKGRQMPVHYGSKELNFVTISSPLTTQLPQAVGAAYGFKREGKKACVICYFGEGASSEGDAHAAFNFAATLACPIIFLCRNNGYAISTPSHEQFKGDGIAAKGPAYGINTIRVDGNDIFAVYSAIKFAQEYCLEEKKPVLIEAMTYRIGSHSTSDDSSAYRPNDELIPWNTHTPIDRFRLYLELNGLWDEQEQQELVTSARKEVLHAFAEAEKLLKPQWTELFTDVYETMPNHIRKQMQSMQQHIKEYHEHYPLTSFKSTL